MGLAMLFSTVPGCYAHSRSTPDSCLPTHALPLCCAVQVKDNGIVLFTYPKANTKGCTTQATGLNEKAAEFAAAGFKVGGHARGSCLCRPWPTALLLAYCVAAFCLQADTRTAEAHPRVAHTPAAPCVLCMCVPRSMQLPAHLSKASGLTRPPWRRCACLPLLLR